MMKKLALSMFAAVLLASPSLAADLGVRPVAVPPPPPPSPWDFAFGGALLSDYNFRGISQSNLGPSVTAYSETRYNVNTNWQLYAGTQYWAVTLPTNPTCECDIYGGLRTPFGPLSLDLGFIYYWYPRERQHLGFPNAAAGAVEPQYSNGTTTLKDTDFWEVYAKGSYEVMKDKLYIGFNEFYSPSWLHTGAYGNFASGTAKLMGSNFTVPILGEMGWYLSGEAGYYWFGKTNVVAGVFPQSLKLPNYATWNVGLAFTRGVTTWDIRYYDTNLSRHDCYVLTGDPGAGGAPLGSRWCGAAFITSFRFDLTSANLR